MKKIKASNRLGLSAAASWMEIVLFNRSSRQARIVACSIIEMMCNNYERKKEVITLLTCFLSKLSEAGESSAEFLQLYQHLIQDSPWKQYLTIQVSLTFFYYGVACIQFGERDVYLVWRISQNQLSSIFSLFCIYLPLKSIFFYWVFRLYCTLVSYLLLSINFFLWNFKYLLTLEQFTKSEQNVIALTEKKLVRFSYKIKSSDSFCARILQNFSVVQSG